MNQQQIPPELSEETESGATARRARFSRASLPVLFAATGWLLAAHPLAAVTGASDPFSGLRDNSPFDPPGTKAVAAPADDALEFRGMVMETGGSFFSIYDKASHRSTWVESNNPANGLSVKRYDAAHESVIVEYQGKPVTLSLKRATVTLIPPTPAPPDPASPSQAAVADSAPRPFRIGHVAEEVARRQGLRRPPAAPPKPAASLPEPDSP